MRIVLVASLLGVVFSAGTGRTGQSHAAITSKGGLMRQHRDFRDPWSWVVGDSWQGVIFHGATSPKKSVPVKLCMIHRENEPRDVLCLFAGDSEGALLKSFEASSEWVLEERAEHSAAHRPANYSLRLVAPQYPTPDDEGNGASSCTVSMDRATCCLSSRLPINLGNKGRVNACEVAVGGGGMNTGNVDCLTTAVRECELDTAMGDSTQGWTFVGNRLMQRGNCLTRVDKAYLNDLYSLSVQPCAKQASSDMGQQQQWFLHQHRTEDSTWEMVDPNQRDEKSA